MSNLEKEMKRVAAKLTGRSETEIPETLEEICGFIAENYKDGEGERYTLPAAEADKLGGVKKAAAVAFETSEATAETCAAAIAGIISNLKAAGIMA